MIPSGSNAWITFRLAPTDAAPARARAQLGGLLDGLPETTQNDALVMLSEVVTNAVRHSKGSITVTAETDGVLVDVSVADDESAAPYVKLPSLDAESGRGLALVASLADTWGVRRLPGGKGKTVWFRLSSEDAS